MGWSSLVGMVDDLPAAVVAYLVVLRPLHREILERLATLERRQRRLMGVLEVDDTGRWEPVDPPHELH